MPPNSTEILQAILEAMTMERLVKNKLTRTSERRKRLKKFQFSAVACTSKENDILLGTDRKYLEKRPINYYAPAKDIWVCLFPFHYLHGWSHLLGDIATLGTVSEVCGASGTSEVSHSMMRKKCRGGVERKPSRAVCPAFFPSGSRPCPALGSPCLSSRWQLLSYFTAFLPCCSARTFC